MALKGHTTIELTNVETGEVEVYEDDNMVTNALSKLLGNTCGVFHNNPLSNVLGGDTDSSVIKRLTGGLMLFDKQIEENPDIVNSPSGVSVIGCGSQVAYNGENVMAGSYNQAESGWTEEGGYKHVWDFTTSQSNGNIACASLTTNAGGKITEGTYPYASDYVYAKGNNIVDEVLFLSGNTYAEIGNLPVVFTDGINNRIITAVIDDDSLYVNKSIELSFYRFGFTNFSIFDSPTNLSNIKKVGSVTVNIPNELKEFIEQYSSTYPSHYWTYFTRSDDNNIYILLRFDTSSVNPLDSLAPGKQLHILQINSDNYDVKYYSFVNNLDESIYTDYNGARLFAIANDYILCVGTSSSKYYLIKKENNLEFSIPTYPNGDTIKISSFGECYIIVNNDKFIVCDSYPTRTTLKVIDPSLEYALRYKNINANNFMGTMSVFKVFKIKGTLYWVGINISGRMDIYLDPTLLVTINNLETPVQKTSAQTMKVTYVLTQE